MKIDFVCVSGRTLDTEPSFFICVDGMIYLFNVPDGTQRLFMQHKWKLGRIKQLFFTSHTQEALGGILGAVMTSTEGREPPFGMTLSEAAESVLKNTVTYTVLSDALPVMSRDFKDSFLDVRSFPLTASLAFMIQLCDCPGKFMPNKAKELGMTPGPLFKQLQSGQAVSLPDGRTIEPAQVMSDPTPGDVIFVVDCKCSEDLEIVRGLDLSRVTFFVHLTHPIILATEEYRKLFPFSERVKHVCFMESGRVSFEHTFDLYKSICGTSLCAYGDSKAPDGFQNMYKGMSYGFIPLGRDVFRDELKLAPVSDVVVDPPLPSFDSFAVTFLGTAAKMPSKHRNPTGILVHMRNGFVLFDIGENTLGQLRRKYGVANTEHILKNLKLIWISHYHGDHLFGAPQLLEARAKLTDEVIPLMCDQRFINELQARDQQMGPHGYKLNFMNRDTKEFEGDGFKLQAFSVVHCEGSHACLLTIDNKYRLAFSGDRGCTDDEFVSSVDRCDVLIHEATFSDDLIEKANEVCHSTISGAIATGKRCGATYTILTHASNRYTGQSLTYTDPNVLFAFDYLHFTLESLAADCQNYKDAFNSIQNKDSEE